VRPCYAYRPQCAYPGSGDPRCANRHDVGLFSMLCPNGYACKTRGHREERRRGADPPRVGVPRSRPKACGQNSDSLGDTFTNPHVVVANSPPRHADEPLAREISSRRRRATRGTAVDVELNFFGDDEKIKKNRDALTSAAISRRGGVGSRSRRGRGGNDRNRIPARTAAVAHARRYRRPARSTSRG